MTMPNKLIFVRHGQSEANIIQHKIKKGEIKSFPKKYNDTPDREIRLSELGKEQTKKTGEYLKEEYPQGVDIIFVSDHTRAKETAALVCLHAGWDNVQIKVDPQLGERNWGNFHHQSEEERASIFLAKKRDPLHTPFPDGETLIQARLRTRTFLDRCSRQYSGKTVLVFTHGEYIECVWSEIANMRTEQQRTFFNSPDGDIKNCQVVEFESVNGKLDKVKSSNPFLDEIGDLKKIEKRTFTPKELLNEVRTYPSILTDED